MMHLHKPLVLAYLEFLTPAVHDALPCVLAPVDMVHETFLEALGLDPVDALQAFNLAPLPRRMDIATLGMIHRVVLGLAMSGPFAAVKLLAFELWFCVSAFAARDPLETGQKVAPSFLEHDLWYGWEVTHGTCL